MISNKDLFGLGMCGIFESQRSRSIDVYPNSVMISLFGVRGYMIDRLIKSTVIFSFYESTGGRPRQLKLPYTHQLSDGKANLPGTIKTVSLISIIRYHHPGGFCVHRPRSCISAAVDGQGSHSVPSPLYGKVSCICLLLSSKVYSIGSMGILCRSA
ncbi:hypothetical protein BO78DRAFT_213177 [Aspergillus sclerotiicarbonarius CBS 121057]|uniref:Uncharacterized protein n=1 Tax=Aspergillus sclerotiicarbonarius (strain CBS 121057 / IBT 28362) TaxID=1448318 RepID=A0A319EPQ3_ASPSB|nr:hypothetical protein BO78DRAFT_213177 [Aspergillus sclerotiicarbonarius CBS 121057]